jgi:hypothetical protein
MGRIADCGLDNLLRFKFNRTQIYADNRRNKKDAMRIALSAKRFSVYLRVQKGISYTIKLRGKDFE